MNSRAFQILKNTAFVAAKSPAFDRFMRWFENADGNHSGFLRVLTYHRIDEPTRRPWLDPGLISASARDFEEQMTYLKAYYQIVSVGEVLAALNARNEKVLPPRAVLVTFDDGYVDFEEQAWPILRRYKIPATLFIPTAYPDHPEQTFWWDDLHQAIHNTGLQEKLNTPIGTLSLSNAVTRNQAYQRLKIYMKTLKHADAILRVGALCRELGVQPAVNCIMSWASLRNLSQDGLTVGAHTRTHPLLTRISLDEAEDEVTGSFEDLKREIGSVLPVFAYPDGQFNNDVVSMLGHAGLSHAFTTERGVNDIRRMNPFRIKRINVGSRTPLPVLRAELLSGTVHFTSLQSRLDA